MARCPAPARPQRIGLFGGTFDPPHWAHYLIAREARELLALDEVVFLPCRRSPHKTGLTRHGAERRLAMLKALLRGDSWARVSRLDLDRKGTCYSHLTAADMARHHPGARLFWIMGSDQWEVLPTWKSPEKLAALVEFAVFPRPDSPRPRKGMILHALPSRYDISASQIRGRIREGKSIKGLVPGPVARYIVKPRTP